ncbi:hypothetical protein JTB14_012828 [Gonioctena quinquepunctata]|nr:hypothetical protein JTB14_012828 [Gonioctena quinquepunctata]
MFASIDINNFDSIEIHINEETGEMAEEVKQVGGNDSEAGANENDEVLGNDQLAFVDDDIGELVRRFRDLTIEQSDGCVFRCSITFLASQTIEDGSTDKEVPLLKDNFGSCIENESYPSAQDLKEFIKKTAISRLVPADDGTITNFLDVKLIKQILFLPQLVPPKGRLKLSTKTWKFTAVEYHEGFLVHVTN